MGKGPDVGTADERGAPGGATRTQPVASAFDRAAGDRVLPRFPWSARVLVEAPARLLPEPSRRHVLPEQRARTVLRVAEALVHHLEDREAGIETDEVGERQGAH